MNQVETAGSEVIGDGSMYYLADRAEMQEIDRRTIQERGIPGLLLMERAAICVLEEINRRLRPGDGRRLNCLVVVEGGNNGGDGLALARLLSQQGDQVEVCFINGLSKHSDSFTYQLDIVKKLGIEVSDQIHHREYDVIVDGIFGVGLKRGVAGIWQETIEKMNLMSGSKVAIDVPSGVDASSGQILNTAFRADITVTFGLNKIGLVLHPGCDMAGVVVVRDIGFADTEILAVAPRVCGYDRSDLAGLPVRSDTSNKGTYGRVAVIAGSRDMSGAMTFAAEAAYRMGAGLVKVYTHSANRTIAGLRVPEAVLMTYDDETGAESCAQDAVTWADVILIGPGIGMQEEAGSMVRYVMSHAEQPVLADADALNIMARDKAVLSEHRGDVIITPHMGEMSRLVGRSIPDIKKNILEVCKDFAMEYNVINVLKDSRTCVSCGESSYINNSGNNGMSTAGAGDVLTGVIAGLVATGLKPFEAAKLGVYIHGMAGDLAAERMGQNGMLARDIVEAISDVIKGAEHDG